MAALPADLLDRRVEITGPTDRKMVRPACSPSRRSPSSPCAMGRAQRGALGPSAVEAARGVLVQKLVQRPPHTTADLIYPKGPSIFRAIKLVQVILRVDSAHATQLAAATETPWAAALPRCKAEIQRRARSHGLSFGVLDLRSAFCSRNVGPCSALTPGRRAQVINALNSGASVYMADFEDSNCPTWSNLIEVRAPGKSRVPADATRS